MVIRNARPAARAACLLATLAGCAQQNNDASSASDPAGAQPATISVAEEPRSPGSASRAEAESSTEATDDSSDPEASLANAATSQPEPESVPVAPPDVVVDGTDAAASDISAEQPEAAPPAPRLPPDLQFIFARYPKLQATTVTRTGEANSEDSSADAENSLPQPE